MSALPKSSKKNNSFMEYNYHTNEIDIIGQFTEESGDDFVDELVADRSFLSSDK